jgi:hypothetical protein
MPHTILITTHKCKIQKKNYLNPRWGISFKLGQILQCILKIRGGYLGELIHGERFEQGTGGRDQGRADRFGESSVEEKEEERK